MNAIQNPGRRRFLEQLAAGGAFVLAARYLPDLPAAEAAQVASFRTAADSSTFHPSVYLGIQPDGRAFIVTHRSEMGTGIRTSLPLVLADELEADWSRVTVEQGIGDPRYGDQNTDGSRSIRDFYEVFRLAERRRGPCSCRPRRPAGTCRRQSARRATTRWCTPAGPQPGLRRAGLRRRGASGPGARALRLKATDAFRYIGKPSTIVDATDIVTGKARFGLDVRREDGVRLDRASAGHGRHDPVVGRPRRAGGQGVTQSCASTPSRRRTFKPLGGVAVVASGTWAALQGGAR